MKKYDVFISSKSEDYHLAEEVYKFLIANDKSVFVASKELKKIGKAKYADAIDEVLDNIDHMIVVASSLSNIKSKWVKYEWSTFSNDLKNGYKEGNLLTILNGIELKSLPASLRHQQSFNFDSYKNFILDYLKIDKEEDSSKPHSVTKQITSAHTCIFKFYSNENCQIIFEGKKIAEVIGMSDEPYYLHVSRKGEYRFICILDNGKKITIDSFIDYEEEKIIHIKRNKVSFQKYILHLLLGFTFILNVMIFTSFIYLNKDKESSIKTSVNHKTVKTETYKTQILITEKIE